MEKLTYTLTPFDAVLIVECLEHLKELERINLAVSSEAEYSPDEIHAVIKKLKSQHPDPLN